MLESQEHRSKNVVGSNVESQERGNSKQEVMLESQERSSKNAQYLSWELICIPVLSKELQGLNLLIPFRYHVLLYSHSMKPETPRPLMPLRPAEPVRPVKPVGPVGPVKPIGPATRRARKARKARKAVDKGP